MLAGLTRPILADPLGRLLGEHASEAGRNAELVGAALASGQGPWRAPLEWDGPPAAALVDPLAAMVIAPCWGLVGGTEGFALGWNALWAGVLVASAVGAWAWARAWVGGEWGPATAATIAASSLFLVHLPAVGRLESLFYALHPLHGAAIFLAIRGRPAAWAAAALTAAMLVQSGGVGLAFLLLTDTLVGGWALLAAPRRATVLGLGSVAIAIALSAWPVLAAARDHPYPAMAEPRGGLALRDPWALLGVGNLLDDYRGYEVSPWIGAAALVAGLGAVATRRYAPALVGLVLLVLAVGPAVRLGREELALPAAFLEALPEPAGLVRGWPRLLAIVVPLLGVAAAGWVRGPRSAVPLMLLALGEAELRRPVGASWTVDPPPPGVLDFPRDARVLLREWLLPETRPPAVVSELFEPLDPLSPSRPPRLDPWSPAIEVAVTPCRWRAAAVALRAAGYREVVPHADLTGSRAERAHAALSLRLGDAVDGRWALPADPACDAADTTVRLALEAGAGAERGPMTEEERAAKRAERAAERERREAERRR